MHTHTLFYILFHLLTLYTYIHVCAYVYIVSNLLELLTNLKGLNTPGTTTTGEASSDPQLHVARLAVHLSSDLAQRMEDETDQPVCGGEVGV